MFMISDAQHFDMSELFILTWEHFFTLPRTSQLSPFNQYIFTTKKITSASSHPCNYPPYANYSTTKLRSCAKFIIFETTTFTHHISTASSLSYLENINIRSQNSQDIKIHYNHVISYFSQNTCSESTTLEVRTLGR